LIPGSDKRFFACPKLKAGSADYPPANSLGNGGVVSEGKIG